MFFVLCTLLSAAYVGFRFYQVFYEGNNNITKSENRKTIIDKYGKIAYKFRSKSSTSDKLVVCFHGLTVNANYFDNLDATDEYDVLAFDLYGHGWSSSIDKELTLDRLSEQALILLVHICKERENEKYKNMTFIGCSFGAMVLNNLKLRYPLSFNSSNDIVEIGDLIENSKNILVAPAGIKMNIPLAVNLINVWGVGEVLVSLFGRDIMKDFCVTNFNDKNNLELNSMLFLDSHPGFLKSVFSIVRNVQTCNYDYRNLINATVIVSKSDNLTLINTSNFSDTVNIINKDHLGHAELYSNSLDEILSIL
jgi:hypothetical protein